MRYDEQVLNYVDSHRSEAIQLLQKLIQTESITGDESKIAHVVAEECRRDGLEVELLEPSPNRTSVVARYRGTTGKPRVMWYSHCDTLPAGDLSAWKYPAFSGSIAEGYVWGRGASDNKTATCASIMAFRALKNLGVQLKGDIVFTHVCDEERGGKYGFKYLVDNGYGEGIDYLFYPHGGSLEQITIASNGCATLDIEVAGKASSTSKVEEGVNAIHNAARLILRLEKLGEEVNSRTYRVPGTDSVMKSRFSINRCHAYAADNAVPAKCELRVDRRFTPAETLEQVEKEVKEIMDGLRAADPRFDGKLTVTPDMLVSVSTADSELVKAIQRSAKRIVGYEPKPVGGSHSSDHGWFNSKYHKPLASYGIGGEGNHSPNERIKVEDVILTTKAHCLIMIDLLGKT